jgi:hypothetical protein
LALGAQLENNRGVKLFVLAFGVLGLAIEFAHVAAFKEAAHHPLAHHGLGLMMIAGFGLPCVIALVDLARPLSGGPYVFAACCFVAVFIRARMWELITSFADLSVHDRLYFGATIGGILASAIAARRP